MSNPYIVLPVIFQLFVAVTLMFSWTNKNLQKLISVVGSLIALLISISLFDKSQSGGNPDHAGGRLDRSFLGSPL